MSQPTTRTYKSISSDNVLFDFELIIKRTKKSLDIDENHFMFLMRAHFHKLHPYATSEERMFLVANYLSSAMTYDKFVQTLDILNVTVSLNITPINN